jgi:dienelactone hydrolase
MLQDLRLRQAAVCAALVASFVHGGYAQSEPELVGSVAAGVRSGSGLVQRVSITVGDGGSGPFKSVLTGDERLTTHALYRPRDLSFFGPNRRLPIVAWANGGCRNSSGEFRNFLSEIASHGFLIVAIGPAAYSAVMGSEAPTGTSQASQLIDGVNWALAENAREGSDFHQKIDIAKVAIMGQSCGGVQALDVSKDPRVTTTVIWNSAVLSDILAAGRGPAGISSAVMNSMAPMISRVTRERLSELHAPIAYFIGGPSDVAHAPAAADFERINHVPVLLANRDVGHYPATYREPNGGAFAAAAVAWLSWQLKGDQAASRMFVGDDCGLCRDSVWTIQRKNLQPSR